MKNLFTTKRICRAGVIAALYVALTCSFGQIAYSGIFEIRPAEALCILPLFYIEAIPALYVGCMLSNLISQFGIYDIFLGSLATLAAAICTYVIGRVLREKNAKPMTHVGRVALGGLFPVLFNAFLIPVVIVILYGDLAGYATAGVAYWYFFASMVVTESVWIYALGTPLYLFVYHMRARGLSTFLDGKKVATPEPAAENSESATAQDQPLQ